MNPIIIPRGDGIIQFVCWKCFIYMDYEAFMKHDSTHIKDIVELGK